MSLRTTIQTALEESKRDTYRLQHADPQPQDRKPVDNALLAKAEAKRAKRRLRNQEQVAQEVAFEEITLL